MGDDLAGLIHQCIEMKAGNKEFTLLYYGGDDPSWRWKALVGNTCEAVNLGESSGEFETHAATAEDAVRGLIALMASPTTSSGS